MVPYNCKHLNVVLLTMSTALLGIGKAYGLENGNIGTKCLSAIHNYSEFPQKNPVSNHDWYLESLNLTMRWIPAGKFYLGSTQEERDWAADPNGGKAQANWFTDESDLRKAELDYGFWMGETTITRGMFRSFVKEEDYRTDAEKNETNRIFCIEKMRWKNAAGVSWRNPGYEQNDSHPVVFVSWADAMAFCDWLNRTERENNRLPKGYEYRLPGEAEWEYAAQGGIDTHTVFWWGDEFSEGEGRFNAAGADRLPNGNRWDNSYEWKDGFVYTSPVNHYGEKGLNGFGLADMTGNVWEWCYDGYNSDGTQPAIWLEVTEVRMLRGGSYMRPPGSLRIANRGRGLEGSPRPHRGFRIALAPEVVTATTDSASKISN